jgi:hypothetical protein
MRCMNMNNRKGLKTDVFRHAYLCFVRKPQQQLKRTFTIIMAVSVFYDCFRTEKLVDTLLYQFRRKHLKHFQNFSFPLIPI